MLTMCRWWWLRCHDLSLRNRTHRWWTGKVCKVCKSSIWNWQYWWKTICVHPDQISHTANERQVSKMKWYSLHTASQGNASCKMMSPESGILSLVKWRILQIHVFAICWIQNSLVTYNLNVNRLLIAFISFYTLYTVHFLLKFPFNQAESKHTTNHVYAQGIFACILVSVTFCSKGFKTTVLWSFRW